MIYCIIIKLKKQGNILSKEKCRKLTEFSSKLNSFLVTQSISCFSQLNNQSINHRVAQSTYRLIQQRERNNC